MKNTPFQLGNDVNLQDLYEVSVLGREVALPAATKQKMNAMRKAMLNMLATGRPIYGINTGFGELASTRIPGEKLDQLQTNLIRSHACGAGHPMGDAQVRGLIFLRANELARCHSGIRPEVVQVMADMLNKGVIPHVPSRGSVGASGDLAPSAHIALVVIGEGRALISDGDKSTDWMTGAQALAKAGIKPVQLHEKEGLSLINGTQAMQSVGGLALIDALKVWSSSLVSGAMTVEALKGTPAPFCKGISELKPHPGQIETAAALTRLIGDSEIRKSHLVDDTRVQDPYSLRCMPQVHGSVRDAIEYAMKTVEVEMGSSTDNPLLVMQKTGSKERLEVISGGNFHGEALSMSFDFACMGMVALGNITERRIFQMVSDSTKILPPFLSKNPGLESGWMITQYAAASIASENKTLAHPASADSIPTSGNKEDFVSMGMWAAIKLDQVVNNTATIVGLELLAAAQGLEMHKPLRPSPALQEAVDKIWQTVPPIKGDTSLADHIELMRQAVLDGEFIAM